MTSNRIHRKLTSIPLEVPQHPADLQKRAKKFGNFIAVEIPTFWLLVGFFFVLESTTVGNSICTVDDGGDLFEVAEVEVIFKTATEKL